MYPLTQPYRIWKTVTIGNGFSEKQLVEELFYADCEIDHFAAEFIRRSEFRVSPIKEEVDFVLVAVMQLGLIRASFEVIMERARELGFQPCSVEAALMLRLELCQKQMSDEETESISLAMDPILTTYQHRYRRPSVLSLFGGNVSVTGRRELGVRHLSCTTAGGKVIHDGELDDQWAFVLPRK